MSRLALAFLFAAVLFGQIRSPDGTGPSVVAGKITDQTGEVVSGAMVTATNVDTKTPYVGGSSQMGNFAIPVPPGKYDVIVIARGFKKFTISGVPVEVGPYYVPLNLKLTPSGQPTRLPPAHP